jgi:hypothetical protein
MAAIQQILFGSGSGIRFFGISDVTIFSSGTFGATAAYGLNQGSITQIAGFGGGQVDLPLLGTWVSPNSAASNYQVLATQNPGGTAVVGTLGTWVNLGPNIQWFLNVNTDFRQVQVNASLAISIRRKIDNEVISSATITLNAIAEGNE